MRRIISIILAFIMLLACTGCFWGVEDDRRGHWDDRDRGRHEGDRHDDRGGHDERH